MWGRAGQGRAAAAGPRQRLGTPAGLPLLLRWEVSTTIVFVWRALRPSTKSTPFLGRRQGRIYPASSVSSAIDSCQNIRAAGARLTPIQFSLFGSFEWRGTQATWPLSPVHCMVRVDTRLSSPMFIASRHLPALPKGQRMMGARTARWTSRFGHGSTLFASDNIGMIPYLCSISL